jgi:hypothetical protein
MFEKRVMKIISVPKKPNILCPSPHIAMVKSRSMRWAKHVAHMKAVIKSYTTLISKSYIK